jgi:hypothetical protein
MLKVRNKQTGKICHLIEITPDDIYVLQIKMSHACSKRIHITKDEFLQNYCEITA